MPKRKPGEKEKKGKTKEAILRFILNHPQGAEEDKLRSYLKEKFNISDNRGIKGHLSKLNKDDFEKTKPAVGAKTSGNITKLYKEEGATRSKSKSSKFLRKKGEPGKTNLWYVRYDFNVLLDLIEEYPDLKKDVLKWLIRISEEKEGEYRKLFLAKKILPFDELTKLAVLIEKLDGGSLPTLLLGTDSFRDIILSLINQLDLSIKRDFNIKLSHCYTGKLFVLLVNSPTAFVDFIRFMVNYHTKGIDIEMISELRKLMGIHPIRISEMEDGLQIRNVDNRWFEIEHNPTYEISLVLLTLFSELDDILYHAFMKDLNERTTPRLAIRILRDTQNNLIELEKGKKGIKKMGKKSFWAYLKPLLRSENKEAHDLKLEKEES